MIRKKVRAALVCAATLATVTIGAALAPNRTAGAATGPAGSVPAGLPAHVMVGLANDPGDLGWMTGSGVPWDARYQYLSGGVNTASNGASSWSTWNSPAGAFALWYMQNSGANGYLPVFSYYQMLQSNPASGSSEGDKDYSNLNNASTMNAYFADFKLLMDQARQYGQPVIVQVEPDLWGYLEQKAGSCGKASCVSAAVASSGYADVASYPNTAQGFAEALLHLRDKYAPNVIMAIHASCWGSGADVCNYPTSTSDTANHAAQDAAFLSSAGITGNQAGTSSWNLVFTDTSDRDAGYYQYVYGNTRTWWDPTNSVLPNFANFRTWLAGINAGTGRRIVLWQTPLGNQYFDTENNTNGHYQDNRAQYFLGDGPSYGHLTDFANAGVVGVLFGAGAAGPTTYTDAMGDGITNPAPVNSFQCNGCNTHTSQYSDDDGGYLRIFGGSYLRAGGVAVPSSGTGATATPGAPTPTQAPATNTPVPPTNTPASTSATISSASASPASVVPGGTESLVATISTNAALSGAVVDFEVYNAAGTQVYQTYQSPVSFAATTPQTVRASWAVPAGQAAGTYTLKVGVFGAGWTPLYTWDDNAAAINVSSAAATSTPAPPTATATKTPVPPTATATKTPVPPTATATKTPVPPTATPTRATASPTATQTAAPLAFTFKSAAAGPASVAPGATEHFTATIGANRSASNELVDFEVYNSSGAKVWQTSQSPVSFRAGVAKRFTASWAVPAGQATGTYTLKLGVFTSAWSFQAWDNSAATFTVAAPSGTLAHKASVQLSAHATAHAHRTKHAGHRTSRISHKRSVLHKHAGHGASQRPKSPQRHR